MSNPAETGSLLSERALVVVTACQASDLPVLQITAQKLAENVRLKSLHVIAPNADCARIRDCLGGTASVIAEDDFIPGMTPDELRKLPRPQFARFPKAAGWYFQQLLKLQFAFQNPEDDYYLIWDADTVPLRPLHFFDDAGRMLLTKAQEFHPEYFETYQRLFQEPANREFSCIAQHMVVQKSVAREMLEQIQQRIPGSENWAWKIMRHLPAHRPDEGDNCFSEYETYGHYLKNHYPDRVRFIERRWLREGAQFTNGWIPNAEHLQQLGQQYDYVAFERVSKTWLQWSKNRLKQTLKRR